MKFLCLIRHGASESNLKHLYLGRRDEPLCAAGIEQAQNAAKHAPEAGQVFCSPLKRCLETAAIIYPGIVPQIIPEFIEIDFGRFEGRLHSELLKNEPAYQTWLDSGGEAPIPDGESMAQLKSRVKKGFFRMLGLCTVSRAAAVVHGGTIMALLSTLGLPRRSFYGGFTQNCQIVQCRWDGSALTVMKEGRP
jgi:alpha-ribazole phosphatase